jgi:Flp pilus assembly protein TadB
MLVICGGSLPPQRSSPDKHMPMYPKGWKQQFTEFMAVLFVASFVLHLVGAWLAPLLPVVLVLALLAGIVRLVLWWRRRGW